MATRTKGFFEQDRPNKKPGQWHRHSRPALQESHINAPCTKPPIPATAHAKSKLKAFQFDSRADANSDSNNSDKENEATPVAMVETDHPFASHDAGKVRQDCSSEGPASNSAGQAPKPPSLPHANTFPSTPSGRLPLEALIGNGEEPRRKAEAVHESPDQQIGWNPHSSAFTPHRKRKRARSSSPSVPNTSSQPPETSAFLDENDAQMGKTTPEADPVAALWQAYGGRQADANLALPDFSHLIVQASPHPMETPIKGSAFRRWASTGNDWPTSNTKRRCTNSAANINQWHRRTAIESGSKSKVASMVQKIQESLATQKLEQAQSKPMLVSPDGPSSSSPLPETATGDLNRLTVASPLISYQRQFPRRMPNAVPCPSPEAPNASHSHLHSPCRQRHETANPLMQGMTTQDSVISAPLHLQSKARLPAYKRPSITRVPSAPKLPQPPPLPTVHDTEVDDFEDAFDLTADDLDELMIGVPLKQRQLYDIPPHPDPPPPQRQPVFYDQPKLATNNPTLTAFDEDDEFGYDDIDEATLVQAEISATQARRTPTHQQTILPSLTPLKNPPTSRPTDPNDGSAPLPQPCQLHRYTVKKIVEGEYTNARGARCNERIILAEASRDAESIAITLRGSWTATPVSHGNVVNIANLRRTEATKASNPPGQVMIDDNEGSPLLVIHPDHMLSATTVADSFDCIRKAVLQDRIKATGDTNKPMVYGKILHEIFQLALSANRWDVQFLSELVDNTVLNHIEGLWELGMRDTNLAVEEIKTKMAELAGWASTFVMPEPSATSLVDDQQGQKIPMSISKLIAIEEHIWSPQYGLKGNIDATVESTVIQIAGERSRKLISPFELKTGRTTQSPAHRAQTALYTLLLSDRYDVNVTAGILHYLESSNISRVAPPVNEIRQMVQQRNRLAAYVHSAKFPSAGQENDSHTPQSQEMEESSLPGLLKVPFKCGKCYANQSCFTYHALQENGSAETAGMIDDGRKDHSLVWQEVVGHLELHGKDQIKADKLKRWFSKWDRLLTFEETEQSRLRKELWTMSSAEREMVGRCFGNLILAHDLTSSTASAPSTLEDGIEGSGGKINRFAYVFTRPLAISGRPFTEGSQLTIGEPIVVSSEKGQWALANGYVVAMTKHEITVAVDRKLGTARQRLSTFESEHNQAFRGIMNTRSSGHDPSSSVLEQTFYRLDKDEFSNGLAMIRNNLVTLMSSHPIHTKLRSHVIFETEPTFANTSSKIDLKPSQLGKMNLDQQEAVQRVLSAKDYALILGMPGTGKTTTIAHVIRALLAGGQSILLTSFTHTAVDNILLKIRDIVPPGGVLRLGVPTKINDQVQEFCQLAATPRKTIEEIDEAYMGTQIVATTCMGTNHALFNRRVFDVCIVDEASQITLPTILGPLLRARKFILVGDHYQLPPLVQNKAALDGGLDNSLFRQLSEAHPHAIAKLGLQYRMCSDIMSLSNELIYDGQLRCGNDAVATRSLHLDHPDALRSFHSAAAHTSCPGPSSPRCWLARSTDPQHKVVFLNTDPAGASARETLSSTSKNITNPLEAQLATELVLALLALGVRPADVGVITLYRSQLALLRQLFRRAGVPAAVDLDSADRFQGRDKDCIVLSMVRANDAGTVGDLLKDWRRVNVALTRAKAKLVVLGSRRTLSRNPLLQRMVELMASRAWVVDVPQEVEGMHGRGFATQEGKIVEGEEVEEAEEQNGKDLRVETGMLDDGHADADADGQVFGKTEKIVRGGLKESANAGNRMLARKADGRSPPAVKVIEGKKSAFGGSKVRRAKEQIAMEILEDL